MDITATIIEIISYCGGEVVFKSTGHGATTITILKDGKVIVDTVCMAGKESGAWYMVVTELTKIAFDKK